MFLSCCLLCLSSFLGKSGIQKKAVTHSDGIILFLIIFLFLVTGVMSQTLTQSSSEIKKPGERVKMSCKGSGYTYTSYWVSWVQQVPGRGLTWIGWIDPSDGETKYSSSYQGRFTITSDESINTAYLQIDNVKVEDTATYYCARDTVIQG